MDGRLKTYRAMETSSKSQLDLILQVYDGAIDSFKLASKYYKDKDNEAGFQQLERAKRFLTHLYTTLNFEQGGDIAKQLGQLYVFVINQANMIQATKDLSKIDDNIHILQNIREGWQGLKEQEKQQPATVAASSEMSTGHINRSV